MSTEERNNEARFAIVTDSGCDLPAAWLSEHEVSFVPFHVNLNGWGHPEDIEVSPADFYLALAATTGTPAISQPSPAEFGAVYDRLIAQGFTNIVSVHLSSGLSGSMSSAATAVSDVKHRLNASPGETPEVHIELLDTRTASAAEGFVVEDLVRSRDAGLDMGEAVGHARSVAQASRLFFITAPGVTLARDGHEPGGLRGFLRKVNARISELRGAYLIDESGLVRRVRMDVDLTNLASDVVRTMSETSHEEGPVAYVEIGAGMPRFLWAIEKPLDTNEFHSRRLRIANASAPIVSRVGLGALGVAYVPEALLDTPKAPDDAPHGRGLAGEYVTLAKLEGEAPDEA